MKGKCSGLYRSQVNADGGVEMDFVFSERI